MKYFICTEIRLRCVLCSTEYHIQVKDEKAIDTFEVTCNCGGKTKEVNEYGN